MRVTTKAISGISVLLAVLALAGCGSGSSGSEQVAKVDFRSSAIVKGILPARYTCAGQDISPPLEWGTVPLSTADLALFLVAFIPESATKSYKVSVEWAVAGIDPALHKLAAGQLTPSAYLGVASDGKRQNYHVCPKKGATVHYQFELYGIPATDTIAPQFAGAAVISALNNGPTRAIAHGALIALYTPH
jgi:phosphatidylethanolamine-binding protein (PEBP) family uncharacterized protein